MFSPELQQQQPMDPALIAAQMAAARNQAEQDQQMRRVRADRLALEQPWKDPRWLVSADNVLFYFCQRENPFFDPNSDNALVMMQNQGISPAQLDNMLKNMTGGIQFALVEPCRPPLFVIRKQQRLGPDKISPLCYYYVLDGTVYQAPDMHTLVHSRLVSMMDPLHTAFKETLNMLRFQPARGHFWHFERKPARLAGEADEGHEDGEEGGGDERKGERSGKSTVTRATPYQQQRTDALLRALAQRFGGDGDEAASGADAKTEKMDIDSPHSADQQQAGPSSSSATTALLSNFQGLLFASSSSSQQPENNGQIGGQQQNGHLAQ